MFLEFQVGIEHAVILVGCLLAVKGTCEFVSLTKDPFGICRAGCFWLSQWHDCVLVYEAGYPKGLCFLSDKKSCTVLVGCQMRNFSKDLFLMIEMHAISHVSDRVSDSPTQLTWMCLHRSEPKDSTAT